MLGSLFRQLLGKGRDSQGEERPRLSFIICSVDDARFGRISSNIGQCVNGIGYEIVRIRNARSLTAGYNRGLAISRGDLLVFCHDDIEILQPDFGQRLLQDFELYDVFGVAGSARMVDGYWGTAGQPLLYGQVLQKRPDKPGYTLYMFDFHDQPVPPIQGLDGLFIAARREAAQSLGFDEARFDGFHLYDSDFVFRAHLAGLKVGVSRGILLFHESHGNKNEDWRRYMDAFQDKFRDSLPASWEEGPQYALTVDVDDKSGALANFLDIRGNPQRYLEWTGFKLPAG